MRRLGAFLSGWSNGSVPRAAGILVLVNLGVVVVAWGGWALFLLPAFYDARVLPTILMWVFAVGVSMGLLWTMGFWGTVATRGVGHGEEHLERFTPGQALGLGLLRWALQLVMIAGVSAAAVFVTVDGRWWHLFGTDEIDALPDRVAAVPIPADWDLDHSDNGDDGGNHHPNMRFWLTYDVPATYTFDDLRVWLDDPAWTDNPAGRSFGAIRVVSCDTEQQECSAQLVPPAGEPVEYFVRVDRDDPPYDGAPAEVDVQVTYRQYVEPDWEVGRGVVARGRAIPVPADWIADDEDSSSNDSGEYFTRRFGVPATFTPADLQAWITGPTFADPPAGRAFGAITLDECRSYDPGTFGCDATVDDTWSTDEYGIARAGDWVEATLDTTRHTVRVSFRHTD